MPFCMIPSGKQPDIRSLYKGRDMYPMSPLKMKSENHYNDALKTGAFPQNLKVNHARMRRKGRIYHLCIRVNIRSYQVPQDARAKGRFRFPQKEAAPAFLRRMYILYVAF